MEKKPSERIIELRKKNNSGDGMPYQLWVYAILAYLDEEYEKKQEEYKKEKEIISGCNHIFEKVGNHGYVCQGCGEYFPTIIESK